MSLGERLAIADNLDRVHARKALQRVGIFGEATSALPTDRPEVAELLADDTFAAGLEALARKYNLELDDVKADAAAYLREMSAVHSDRAGKMWERFGGWLNRAHDIVVDEEEARRLRGLSKKHSLLFLFSHRSYLDGFILPVTLAAHGISAPFTMGGANLNFFPFGAIASRTGVVFIRRSTSDLPVYRLALRSYIGQLIRNRQNLCWSIEGGRTRTGKLRPPVYGILRYVADAVEASTGPDALIVPVSFVYEQLHEVSMMTSEARGGNKRPEDLRWLVNFARSQGEHLGRAYLDFGTPIPVRERLAELRGEDPDGAHIVERIALDTCHRINRATPVTATAIVCVAMLAADRALSLDEVLGTVSPLARYIERRQWQVAGALNLTDRATVRRTLQELVSSGVLTSYEGGTETIWDIGPQKHLVAAFYRNTAVHILVDRSIGELALVAATESDNGARAALDETLRLRDLLKFDFFFSSRPDFAEEMRTELATIDADAAARIDKFDAEEARIWLEKGKPLIAHLVLRPYLDAYHVVADRLAALEDDDEFDEKQFLDECLRVGKQWAMQKRIASEESVSLELFKPALRLARHRGLVESTAPELAKRRTEFASELAETVRQVNQVAAMSQAHTGRS
ncbi:lysophospholipid acyltransferase [Antrihabitans stalactiti]|uniref:Lysophospholipid acyltransferase n=1 Tax=Antrihabitans stalactiti TaxID=2584121 RepID=A0A848K518_9NOCA|nr:lysophospholipid acyltransferase [Antrihabitans stalactiti]NMN93499.1 lysophospholipid acyltransferase [Antrihabitans stalactiti]